MPAAAERRAAGAARRARASRASLTDAAAPEHRETQYYEQFALPRDLPSRLEGGRVPRDDGRPVHRRGRPGSALRPGPLGAVPRRRGPLGVARPRRGGAREARARSRSSGGARPDATACCRCSRDRMFARRPAAMRCGRASVSCCGPAPRPCPRSWRRTSRCGRTGSSPTSRSPSGSEGVLVAQGGRFGGFSLYVHDGRLHYTSNFAGIERTTVSSPQPLAPGRHVVGVALEPAGGIGMRAELVVGGDVVAVAEAPRTAPVPLRARRRGSLLRLRRRHARGGRLRVAVRVHRHDPRGGDRRLRHAGGRSGGGAAARVDDPVSVPRAAARRLPPQARLPAHARARGRRGDRRRGGRFVVQKHAARRLHYDFRLELDGVLKSWAVPKGPSLDPHEKRLAVHVEDHPLDYGDFEGTIPEGEYGARRRSIALGPRQLGADRRRRGRATGAASSSSRSHGEKLRGGWTLVRMGGRAGEGGKNWLLLQGARRGGARPRREGDIVAERPESVGRRSRARPLPDARRARSSRRWPTSRPRGDDWLHEIKFDGYRALCRVEDGRAQLFTRSGQDWTRPLRRRWRAACAALPRRARVARRRGRRARRRRPLAASRRCRRRWHAGGGGRPALRRLRPPAPRRRRPARAAARAAQAAARGAAAPRADDDTLRYGDHVVGRGAAFLRQALRARPRGHRVEARDAPYRDGPPRRLAQGALPRARRVRGRRLHRARRLARRPRRAAARRARRRTAIALRRTRRHRLLGRARLGELRAPPRPRSSSRRRRSRRSPTCRRGAHWVRPELVAEVDLHQLDARRRLRHPVFVGLRDDKPASEVVRERPRAMPAPRRADETVELEGVRLTPSGPRALARGRASPSSSWRATTSTSRTGSCRTSRAARSRWCAARAATPARRFFQKHLAAGHAGADPQRPHLRGRGGREGPPRDRRRRRAGRRSCRSTCSRSTPGGRARDDVERPDRLVFDLDPDESAAVGRGRRTRRARARLRLEHLGLESFVKTTGGKGLHVVVPLARRHGWDEMKAFARAVVGRPGAASARRVHRQLGQGARRGKIFLDYLRNGRGATAVAAYSARARPGAPVAVPLAWGELGARLRPAISRCGRCRSASPGCAPILVGCRTAPVDPGHARPCGVTSITSGCGRLLVRLSG